jgi:hypothetical protein
MTFLRIEHDGQLSGIDTDINLPYYRSFKGFPAPGRYYNYMCSRPNVGEFKPSIGIGTLDTGRVKFDIVIVLLPV